MNQIKGIAPQFVVSNVVSTAEYYRDKLGFTIIGYFLEPPVYAMVERNGVQLHFGKADGEVVQTTNTSLRKVGFDCYIWVTDVEEFFKELKERKANIVEDLVTRVYGNREFVIVDCNGFRITFGQL